MALGRSESGSVGVIDGPTPTSFPWSLREAEANRGRSSALGDPES